MTVKELIAQLAQFPPNMRVVVDLHSDYGEAASAQLVRAYDNGGYITHAFRAEDKPKEHGWVYISLNPTLEQVAEQNRLARERAAASLPRRIEVLRESIQRGAITDPPMESI
jgi:hypothetical protein